MTYIASPQSGYGNRRQDCNGIITGFFCGFAVCFAPDNRNFPFKYRVAADGYGIIVRHSSVCSSVSGVGPGIAAMYDSITAKRAAANGYGIIVRRNCACCYVSVVGIDIAAIYFISIKTFRTKRAAADGYGIIVHRNYSPAAIDAVQARAAADFNYIVFRIAAL